MSNTSTSGGSDYGRLTDSQRERVEMWNQQLQVVEEVQEDNTTTTEETPTTDHSTVITTPDLAETSKNPLEQTGEEDPDSDDDDSDIELDFLKNFDELAYTSFARKDYSKSEQFLRKAMERSTGDSSGETDFNLLRIRLAICCCLQDKWEFASGALTTLSKTKNASNLPVFHLLQAIALGYLANNRFEDAYSLCKTALQGKKKILGKTSDDFQECLSILALIYEKKGDLLEAEAVRLSITAGWTPSKPESMRSGKQYILDNKSLIDLAFGKKSADTADSSRTSTSVGDGDAPRSGHWTTLTPRSMSMSDGLQRAKRDERTGVPIGNSDTGKEFISQNKEDLIPRRGTEMGILRAINDEYSGRQLGESDSGKEVGIGSIARTWNEPVELPADVPAELPATESNRPKAPVVLSSSTKPRSKLEPRSRVPSNRIWKNFQAPLTAVTKRPKAPVVLSPPTKPRSKLQPQSPMPSNRTWKYVQAPLTAATTRPKWAPDRYSALELRFKIWAPKTSGETDSHNFPSPKPTGDCHSPRIPSWNFGKAVDIRSQDAIITGFVMALERIFTEATTLHSLSCNVGVCLGLGDASFGVSRGNESEALGVSVLLLQPVIR